MGCPFGHKRGEIFEYSPDGQGLVYELCARCDRVIDAIPLEDFPYAHDLMFYLELTSA